MRLPHGATLTSAAPYLALAGLVVAADQLTKALILQVLEPGRRLVVTGFLDLVLAYNRGAAFSLLSDATGWQGPLFTFIGLFASVFLVWLLTRHAHQRLFALALALVLGGALGNVLDRLRFGHVIDFLDFHWGWLEPLFAGGHFPAFNVADSAICCGAALWVLDEWLRMRHKA
ncbi:MAG TPA: signal peptidase II [Burkholderiaceae bacterium]|nr:signal peptidase II [Burkholderiaceae bacterium]